MGDLIHQFIKNFSPPLKWIDTLRFMKVIEEEINLPKIIVVGDLSSVKAKIVGKLVGLPLPEGLKSPLIIRFEYDSNVSSKKLMLKYTRQTKSGNKLEYLTTQDDVTEEELKIKLAEITSLKYGSSIELVVKQSKLVLSGLTIVDLPALDADLGQEKEKRMKGYITMVAGDETCKCVFLHVISSKKDFGSCLSRGVLKEYDESGTRTVPVFSLSDQYVDMNFILALIEKETKDPMPSGYYYVNDVSDWKSAKLKEFSEKDDKFFGIDAVAENLVIAMLSVLFGSCSTVCEGIEEALYESKHELKRKFKLFDSVQKAMPHIWEIVDYASISLEKIFVLREYNKYMDCSHMHAYDRMISKFEKFRSDLQLLRFGKGLFLNQEYDLVTKEKFSGRLQLSSSIMKSLLEKRFHDAKTTINKFSDDVFGYIRHVVQRVLIDHSGGYYQLYGILRKIALATVKTIRVRFKEKLTSMIELEKTFLITSNREEYDHKLKKLEPWDEKILRQDVANLKKLGYVKVDHLKMYKVEDVKIAYEMRLMIYVYWKFLADRFSDLAALHLMAMVKDMIQKGIKEFMREDFIKKFENMEKILELEPSALNDKSNSEIKIRYLEKYSENIEKLKLGFTHLI